MRSRRSADAGFTLLEALLAGAVLAILSIAAFATFGQASRLMRPASSRVAEVEFAQSLLQEVEVLGPAPYVDGTYGDRFRFAVTTAPEPTLLPSRYDRLIDLVRVTIEVTDLRFDDGSTVVSQVMAVGKPP